MGLKGSKSPKNDVFTVVAKILSTHVYCFLLQYESVNGLLNFCKNNMFVKNLALQFKKLKANQNTGFFQLEYLTNKLRYEVEFFGSN